jgi:hypothetical protein
MIHRMEAHLRRCRVMWRSGQPIHQMEMRRRDGTRIAQESRE